MDETTKITIVICFFIFIYIFKEILKFYGVSTNGFKIYLGFYIFLLICYLLV
jgi:hypothetical protein